MFKINGLESNSCKNLQSYNNYKNYNDNLNDYENENLIEHMGNTMYNDYQENERIISHMRNNVIEKMTDNDIIEHMNDEDIIEHIISVGSKDIKTTLDETIVENLTENTKNITNDMRVNAVSKLMTEAINEATQSSSADISKILILSNKISIDGASTSGNFTLSGITQSSTVKSVTDATVVQNLQSKITNEFTTSITKKFSQKVSNVEDIKKNIKKGTNVGDMVGGAIDAAAGLGNNFIDTAGDVLSGALSVGSSKEERTETKKKMSETLKDTLNLSNPLVIEDQDDISQDISNILSQENMAACAEEASQANEINLSNINADEGIDITDIKQVAVVDSAMKCAFNQTAINEMANKVVANIDKMYEQIAESISKSESEEQSGDVYALGEAGKALLVGAGEGVSTAAKGAGEGISTAAKGAGEGISTAAKGAGEGISTAAKGVGEGVSGVLSGLMFPLIIAAVIFALLFVGYIIFKFNAASDVVSSVGDEFY